MPARALRQQTPLDPDRLREWRIAHRLSQQQLADFLGVNRLAVYQWENRRSAIAHPQLIRLALQHFECLDQSHTVQI